MPNIDNILSPITIIGNGRSGTSLVSRLLGRHSQCAYVGETVNLIHSVWKSMESSLPAAKHVDIPDAIRQSFMHFYPVRSSRWMHKPIGIPIIWRLFGDEEEFYTWFWQVIDTVFPEATYFTVLRHPLDVIVSSRRWWGWPVESIIESNRRVANLITHADSQVHYAVNYHDLVSQPEAETKALLQYLKMPFEEDCLGAFKVAHVPSSSDKQSETSDSTKPAKAPITHRAEWDELISAGLPSNYMSAVDACWSKFDYSFGGWESSAKAECET